MTTNSKENDKQEFKNPALAADTIIQEGKGIILIKRRFEPFKGRWAFPGGFVDYGERVEDAAIREAKEETGLDIKLIKLVGVYSDPDRDPRKHVVTITFLAKRVGGEMKETDETTDIKVFDKIKLGELAFDHHLTIKDAGFGGMLE